MWREACATVPPGQRSRQPTGCLSRLRAAKGLSAALAVMLSPCASLRVNSAKNLARGAQRCFAALSMTARAALRAALSGDWKCSSLLATRIQKKQPLFAAAEDKNSMHHKWVARKQVSHFMLVLCFNDHK